MAIRPEQADQEHLQGRSREGIALFHSGAFGIIRTLPQSIHAMRAKGFGFVATTELGAAVGDHIPPNPRARDYHVDTEQELPESSPDSPNCSIQDS